MMNRETGPMRMVAVQYVPDSRHDLPINTRVRVYLGDSEQRWIEIVATPDDADCRVHIYASAGLVTRLQSANVLGLDLADTYERREDKRVRDMAARVFDEFQASGASFNDAIELAQVIRNEENTRRRQVAQWVRDAAATLAKRFGLTKGDDQ
jgi:hypothetical protein